MGRAEPAGWLSLGHELSTGWDFQRISSQEPWEKFVSLCNLAFVSTVIDGNFDGM